ncbi:MAG: putative Ig domain-containing protein [Streptosporangiaceae bacterium]
MSFPQSGRRIVSRVAAVTLLASTAAAGVTMSAPRASAAGTVLFNQTFHDSTVDGTAGSVSLPTAPAASGNTACLTAAGNATANPLASCPTATDAQGSGKLRLTQNTGSQEGGVFASTSVPTSQGLDVTFNSYQYGGNNADGIAFVLAAVNPANPVTPSAIGQSGGALGYSAPSSNVPGLSYGYLGVGFDSYGNFSNHYEGLGCNDPSNIAGPMPGEVVVRGPGNGGTGYCALQSSAATATSQKLTLRATTRAASVVPVEVVYNPSSLSVTTPSGLVVPGGDYDVHFTPVGGAARDLVGALPVVPSGLYPASWVSASGYPKQLAFGWVASTGASTDYHEIDNVMVTTLNPVPQLAVAQTSYAAASLAPGSPVTYSVAASSSGVAENSPVTVTETLPAGVLPAGAYGTGWVCAAPSGQQISCTSSTSPFTGGTLIVNAVVKSGSVTPALVQSGSTALASSSDASPATATSAPAGTVAAAPAVTGITPGSGASGGGNDITVTGTSLSGATAIEIGTAAEFAAGTPTTLNLCASSAPGCFTITSATSLDISGMPAHAAAAVQVSVVSLGSAGTGAYTYNAGPALLFPAPPGGEAGVAYSDQLTVTAGTSPFTWSVSTGALPSGVTLGASTGLLSGTPAAAGSYAFTVKVTDQSGLTATEPVSLTVIAGPSLSFPAPPAGWTHTVYGDTLTESGGTSPYTWTVSSGSLPAGISLSAAGNLTGTPTATGTSSFTVKVTDAGSRTATEATSITVSAGVSTTFTAPPGADVSTPYTDTLTAAGGTSPYTWSVNSGSLPTGLTLTAAGVLAGTPATAGSDTFTVNVIDQNKGIATTSITMVVAGPMTLSFPAPPAGEVGVAYSDTLTAGGGTSPFAWSVSAGTLPAGLTLNASTGVLAGTPTAAGSSGFTVKVTDADGQTAIEPVILAVVSRPSLSFAAPPAGQVGLAYSDTLAVSGGTGPFAWSVSTGTLPAGLTLNASSGALSGTPAAVGSYPFTVQVSDADGVTATEAVTLVVGVGPLVIVASAGSSSAVPGGTVTFTVTVTNTSTTAFTGVTFTGALAGVLNDSVYNGDVAATAGTVSIASPNLTWTGNLAAGAAATITFSVTVRNPSSGSGVLSAAVTSATLGSNCPAAGTDPRCGVTVTVSGLTIVQSAGTATAVPGQKVTYTVTVTNTGQTPYTGAAFTDPLGGVLDDAAYDNDAAVTTGPGAVSYTSPNVAWTGNLAAGATATITFSVTVNNPDTGDDVLASTVTSGTAGSNCVAGSAAAGCTATVDVAVLAIVNGSNVSATTPGSAVRFTSTFTNAGQVPYTGITIASDITGVLDDATPNGDQTATSGTLTLTGTGISWTGSIPVGGTVTVTGTVTVNNPDTGNNVLASTLVTAAPGSNCPASGTDPRCSVSVAVLIPELTIAQTANASAAVAGQQIGFTVTITNTGQSAYTGTTVTASLAQMADDAAYHGGAMATTGSLSFTSPNLTWTGTLAAGAAAVITYTVTVDNPDTGDKLVISTVTSAAAGSTCPPGSTAAACRLTIAVLTPALSITTAAATTSGSNAVAAPGGVVTYTVTVANTGQTPYTGAAVTDPLGGVLDDATYSNDAAVTTGPGAVSYTSPTLTWTGDLGAGAAAVITYTVTVNNPDTGDRVLATTVTSATPGSNCPAGGADARCTATVTVAGADSLTFTQAAAAPSAVAGGVVTTTITIANSAASPYSGAAFTDPLGGVLDDATWGSNVTTRSGTTTYTSTSSTLSWAGDVPAHGTVTITYTVTVNNPDTGDMILASTISSSSSDSNCPAGSPGAGCTAIVTISQLTINFTASTSTTTPGGVVTYTATLDNTGQTPYLGISVGTDSTGISDDATGDGDETASSGTLSVGEGGAVWTGDIPVGRTVTVTSAATVNTPDAGDHVLTATAVSAAPGSNCPVLHSTDPRCTPVTTVLTPALTITQTASTTAPAVPGQTIGFTITVTNTGQTTYTSTTVTASLAQMANDATFDSATPTTGAVVFTSPTLTWTGTLAPAAAAVITYTVTVDSPDTGDKLVIATVTSTAAGSTCPPGTTSAACGATVTVLTPALTITTTASAATALAGSTVGYTITVVNTGQTPYTGATIADPLGSILGYATYNNDAAVTTGPGTVSYTSPVLTWTGNLALGATATITYTITLDNPIPTGAPLTHTALDNPAASDDPADSDPTLTSTVTSADGGTNCPSGSTDPRCTASLTIIPITISMTDLSSGFTLAGVPGDTAQQTEAVTMNVGTNNPTGYSVTVQPTTPTLTASGSTATIPVSDLYVSETGQDTYQPLSSTTPTLLYQQATPSAPDGDALSNDFQLAIPDVTSGTYSTTLTYIATAAP